MLKQRKVKEMSKEEKKTHKQPRCTKNRQFVRSSEACKVNVDCGNMTSRQ